MPSPTVPQKETSYPEKPDTSPTDQWGFELGDILSDFEQDHNAEKAVENIVDLLTRTRQEAYDKGYAEGEVDCGVEIARTGKSGMLDFSTSPWAQKLQKKARQEAAQAIINDLDTNPNPDGSISPNIMHWVERKQMELKAKYLPPSNGLAGTE